MTKKHASTPSGRVHRKGLQTHFKHREAVARTAPLEVGVDPWPDQKRSMVLDLCLMGASGAGLFFYLKILK